MFIIHCTACGVHEEQSSLSAIKKGWGDYLVQCSGCGVFTPKECAAGLGNIHMGYPYGCGATFKKADYNVKENS